MQEGVVNLGVENVGVLKLRVAALAAELCVAVYALVVEAADDLGAGWKAGDSGHEAGQASTVGTLAAIGSGESETCIEDRVLREGVGDAAGDLLVEDEDGAVAAAASGWSLNGGRILNDSLMLAVADEGGGACAEGLVDADVALVISDFARRQGGVIVGQSGSRGRGQGCKDALCKRGSVGIGNDAVRIALAGKWIDEGNRRGGLFDACCVGGEEGIAAVGFGEGAGSVLVQRRNSRGEGRVRDLANTFIVCEEEGVVLPDGTAEGGAELVANEDGLLGRAGEGVGGRGEGADCIEDGVAEIVVSFAVEGVGAAAYADVDDGTGGTTIFGAVVIRFDAELGDGVGGGGDGLIGEALI